MKIDDIQDKIIEEISSLNDWMDKYEYLIDLGRNFNPQDKELKTDENALTGCQSQVWIRAEFKNDRIFFFADSDSLIVKGILALLLRVLNNQPPKAIIKSELYFVDRIGLSTNLSPSRANGLTSIIKQLKWYAIQFDSASSIKDSP
jgi:cysteine desulfuration protein SufE